MAIDGLGISDVKEDGSSSSSYVIRPGTSLSGLYVKWHTTYADNQHYANVAVAWRAVKRGDVPGGGGYGQWERSETDSSQVAWYWRRFPVSELWCSSADEYGSGYWWAAPLDFQSQDGSTVTHKSVAQRIFGGDYTFSGRAYDAVEMSIKVRMEYDVGEGTDDASLLSSPIAWASAWVGYIPEYHAQKAEITTGGLAVDYTCPGWVRRTDRWALDSGLKTSGGKSVVKAGAYGTVAKAGRIVIPSAQLLRDPSGEWLKGTVRFNAVWRPAGMSFSSMSLDGLRVADNRTSNTPKLVATAGANGSVSVKVTDSGDNGVPIKTATVRLVGGEYADLDVQTVGVPGTATFSLPPLGRALTFEAVGRSSTAADSKAGKCTCAALEPASCTVYEALDGSARVRARYDYRPSMEGARDSELVKLAGRKRETAGYGEGASVSRDAEFTVFTRAVGGVETCTTARLDALATAPGVMVRDAKGGRAKLHLESLSYERRDEAAWILKVSIEAVEVS